MNEELLIKLKVDTSSLTATINKVKNEVSNVNKTISATASSSSSTSKAADKATKTTEKLSATISRLVEGMKGLNNLDFGQLFTTIVTTTAATAKLDSSIKKLEKTTKGTSNGGLTAGHFGNALDSLKPNSQLKQDVEITGLKDSLSSFSANMVEGIDSAMLSVKTKLKHALNPENLDLESIQKSFKNLGGMLKGSVSGGLNAAKAGASKLGGALKALGASTAVAGAALAIFVVGLAAFTIAGVKAALSVSKLGKEISNSASQFGFSTKAFQEWSYIMQKGGSSVEDLKGFLETLGSEQAAVITGSEEAAQKFKNLGISAEEAAGMGSQELFEETIKKLQGIEDVTKRSAYAYELFGDEASRLMNVINMSNADMQEAINNYHLLGGAMSGELIESSNRLQSSISNMKQAWQGISNTMAEVFIPVVRAVVNWLTKAFVWINLFLRTIFGLDLKAKDSSNSMDKATSSTKKYTGGIKSATKAAQELRRITMGFDELNVLNNPKSSAADTGGGAGAGGFDSSGIPTIDDSLLDTSKLGLDKMYAWFEEYKGLIKQITTWTLIFLGIGLILLGIFGGLNIPMIILGAGLMGLGITIGVKSGAFAELGKGIKKLWEDLKAWFKENVAPIFTKAFWAEKWDKIKASTSEKLGEIKASISEKWGGVKQWFSDNVAPKFTKQYWKDKFNTVKDGAKEKLEEVKTSISTKWQGVKDWFSSNVAPKFTKTYWKNKFNTIKDGISDKLGEVKTAISTKWSGIKEWFSKNIGVKFTKAYWKEKFNSIPDGIKESFNSVIGIVEKAVNFIIKKINTLSWEVPDWVPGIGGDKWGFNFKQIKIPRLAEGGIATSSTIANIGEAGKEAILPLENNTGWMDALADKIAERNGAPSKVVLKIGEKEFAWAAINGINNITKETGGLQLAL